MTTTGAAMEDDEMEEASLDLGPPEIIMTLTEVTEDLVEQDVAVETNEAVEGGAAQPDTHRKEDEDTLFAMSLVPTLKRLSQQRKGSNSSAAFDAEFNGTFFPLHNTSSVISIATVK